MFDYEQLQRQLIRAGIGEYAPDSSVLVAIEALAYTLDAQELTEEQRGIVLQLFSKVGLEQLERTSKDIPKRAQWVEYQIGVTTFGDIVRVKLDAYDSPSGSKHNGLVGKIESVFAGRVGVRYIGRYADTLQEHPRGNLQVLKKM